MRDWTDQELIKWYEERAAIREFEGGVSRRHANFLAARDLKRLAGRVPDVIMQQIGLWKPQLEQQRNLFE